MASSFNAHQFNRERPLGEVLNDLKIELQDFVSTRVQMLRSEMNDKLAGLKAAAPSMIVGAVVGLSAWMLISLALVFAVSMAFQNQPYQYALSFAIVGILYAVIGGIALRSGLKAIKSRSMVPERTLRVLKQDQIWMKTEAKTEL